MSVTVTEVLEMFHFLSVLWLVLKKELENVIQYRKFIKSKTIKATTQESQFYKELKVTFTRTLFRLEIADE